MERAQFQALWLVEAIRHPGVIANTVATLFEEIPDPGDGGVPRPEGATAGK